MNEQPLSNTPSPMVFPQHGQASLLRAGWIESVSRASTVQWRTQARALLRSVGYAVTNAASASAVAAPQGTPGALDIMFIEYQPPAALPAGGHGDGLAATTGGGVVTPALTVPSMQDAPWLRAWRAARAANKHTLGVLIVPEFTPAALKHALTERMADVVLEGDEAELRLLAVRLAKRTEQRKSEARRVGRLRRKCDKLEASRRELLRQISGLCDGVVSAYTTAAQGMKYNNMSAEIAALLRQELDIENLLRITLEYALKKIGPTNGAIFLPNSCGDYTLGAYVNYDLPKDSAETLIGTLADSLAPKVDQDIAVRVHHRARDLNIESVADASWIADHTITVQACHHSSERLAVVTFFRDNRNPFTPEHLQSLEVIGDAFGRQLAKVVATHHRHKPKPGNFGWSDDENPSSEAA